MATIGDKTIIMSIGDKPTLSLVPPGKCQFTTEFAPSKLISRSLLPGGTTSVLRFGLPDEAKPLNLSTCACILAKIGGGDDEMVVRPYTPISTNALVGSFDLLVKHYENGKMSSYMKTMDLGSTIDFKHIEFNVKIQAPFPQSEIGMIVGGTGITPMIQALHAILGDPENKIKVTMLYGSRISSDILGIEMLEEWKKMYTENFNVIHVLSDEPKDSDWVGERGYITSDLVKSHMPSPSLGEKGIIFVCGPPPMYNALCGDRGSKELPDGTVLKEVGYEASQVYKF